MATVADILLFKSLSAEQSVELVNAEAASLCFSPGDINTGGWCGEIWNELSNSLATGIGSRREMLRQNSDEGVLA